MYVYHRDVVYAAAPARVWLTWTMRFRFWGYVASQLLGAKANRSDVEANVREEMRRRYDSHDECGVYYSLRSTFGAFCNVVSTGREGPKYMLVTGMQHRSYIAFMDCYGLTPIPVDMDFHVSKWDLEGALKGCPQDMLDNVVGCCVAHAFGKFIPYDNVTNWAKAHDVPVLEDAALAPIITDF